LLFTSALDLKPPFNVAAVPVYTATRRIDFEIASGNYGNGRIQQLRDRDDLGVRSRHLSGATCEHVFVKSVHTPAPSPEQVVRAAWDIRDVRS
jgi:hypothetical protein